MKTRGWIVTLVALVAISSSVAVAEVDGDVRAGYYFDAEDAAIGGGILTEIGDSVHWFFNPNLEWVLVSEGDLATLNGDVHYDFTTSGDWTFWLGGGPAVIFVDSDHGDDDTDLGLNLLVGAGLRGGTVRPFVQGKVIVADDTEAVVVFGIRF